MAARATKHGRNEKSSSFTSFAHPTLDKSELKRAGIISQVNKKKKSSWKDIHYVFVPFPNVGGSTKELFEPDVFVGSCKRRAKYTSLERRVFFLIINCVRLLHCVEIESFEAWLQDRLEPDLGRKKKSILKAFTTHNNTLRAIIISIITWIFNHYWPFLAPEAM